MSPDTLDVITERLSNFMHDTEEDRRRIHTDMQSIRDQTHDWMQAMLNRLPTWAVWLGMLMASGLGAETMWIITHK